jgi:hypothetical protein
MARSLGMRLIDRPLIEIPSLAATVALQPKALRPFSLMADRKLPRPVLYGKFDTTKSLWKSDGTLLAPTADVGSNLASPGRFGQALVVSSTAAAALSYSNASLPVNPGTVLAWVILPSDIQTAAKFPVLFSARVTGGETNTIELLIQSSGEATNPLQVRWTCGGPDGVLTTQSDFYSGVQVANSVFAFLGIRWNGTALSGIHNQRLVSGTLSGTRTGNPGAVFYIGTNPYADRNWYGGGVDELAIYDLALTDEQIRSLYEVSREIRGSLDAE